MESQPRFFKTVIKTPNPCLRVKTKDSSQKKNEGR